MIHPCYSKRGPWASSFGFPERLSERQNLAQPRCIDSASAFSQAPQVIDMHRAVYYAGGPEQGWWGGGCLEVWTIVRRSGNCQGGWRPKGGECEASRVGRPRRGSCWGLRALAPAGDAPRSQAASSGGLHRAHSLPSAGLCLKPLCLLCHFVRHLQKEPPIPRAGGSVAPP